MITARSQQITGTIFNIQHFSIHDGPGIRTIVFLKGCPMRCLWCANPESQSAKIQVAYQKGKCVRCGRCAKDLPEAILLQEDGIRIKDEVAVLRDFAEDTCPTGALHLLGSKHSVGEIIDIVEKDAPFYIHSTGGMTLSGGEPLFQAEFALALLKEANRRHIHCAMETCGLVNWNVLKAAAEYLDYILYDIKCIDAERHLAFAGVSNKVILENFQGLAGMFPNMQIKVRTPVIPGFNDDEKAIGDIVDFLTPYLEVEHELLPYHRMGQPKYESLGIPYSMGEEVLDENVMSRLKNLADRRRDLDYTI